MPILDIQHRFRELGRIRAGYKEDTGRVSKKTGRPILRPVKLPRFRLTSPWQPLIEEAAEQFGGEPRPWQNEGATEWEVVVDAEVLPVAIPPGVEVLSQWYELWEGGGLIRRCDGLRQTLVDRRCSCPPDPVVRAEAATKGDACKPTTRLRVMLPHLSDAGTWRLETHGFHAAAELGSAAELVTWATRQGVIVPADLRLVPREGSRRPGKPRTKFFVPALSFRGRLGAVLEALGAPVTEAPVLLAGVEARPSLAAGGTPALPAAGDNRLDPLAPPPVEAATIPGPPPAPPASPPPLDLPAAPGPPPGPPPGTALDVPDVVEVDSPAPFDPPPVEDEPAAGGHGGALTGPQAIAVALSNRGVIDRAERLAVVGAMVGRALATTKDLRPAEVRRVLGELSDPGYRLPTAGPPADWTEPSAAGSDEPSPPESAQASALPPPAPDRPPAGRGAPNESPAGELDVAEAVDWTAEEWRRYLGGAGVKVLEFFAELRRLAAELGEAAPDRLEALSTTSSPSLIGLACSWVEERAEERRRSTT